MAEKPAIHLPTDPVSRIVTIRGQKVILDSDLAVIYGVETKRLNEQVKRNADRFPSDFIFQLTPEEFEALTSQPAISNTKPLYSQHDDANRSQIVTTSPTRPGGSRSQSATLNNREPGMRSQIATASKRNIRFLPYAFTEHGAIMAATVLNSPRAVQMSVFVVRAFIRMRAALTETRELARTLAALEREVKARLDTHDAAIVDILARIMDMIDPPECPEPPQKQIGFSVKERRAKYTTKKPGRRKTASQRPSR